MPFFILATCYPPTPFAPRNGFVSCTNSNEIGSSCTFECEEDFVLIGQGNTECVSGGFGATWSSETPTCKGTVSVCYVSFRLRLQIGYEISAPDVWLQRSKVNLHVIFMEICFPRNLPIDQTSSLQKHGNLHERRWSWFSLRIQLPRWLSSKRSEQDCVCRSRKGTVLERGYAHMCW